METINLISPPRSLSPKPSKLSDQFETIKDIVQKTRTIAADEQLAKPTLITTTKQLTDSTELLIRLSKLGKVEFREQGTGLYLGTSVPAWIEADDTLIAARQHRLQAQLDEKQSYAKGLTAKLDNKAYVQNAPEAVVAETRERLINTRQQAERLGEQLKALQN